MVTTFSYTSITYIGAQRRSRLLLKGVSQKIAFNEPGAVRVFLVELRFAFHIGDPPPPSFALTRHHDHPFPSTRQAIPSSASSYSTIPVTKANDAPQTTSLSFFFFSFRRVAQFFPSARRLAEVRSPRIARPRKPTAIVYRVTVSRDYGSLRILRVCRIAASIFIHPARFVDFSRLLRNFCKTHTYAGASEKDTSKRVIHVSIYYSHLSRDGVKTELPLHTPYRIYFREPDRERTRALFFRRTNAMT